MGRESSLPVLLALAVGASGLCGVCDAEPYRTAGWVGSNYTPAYASNQVQFWHDFRPEVVVK